MRDRRRKRFESGTEDTDPLSGMANLFDLAMVFAVALMVAIVAHFHITDLFVQDDVTMVKNPGKKDMEIIIKKGEEITKYKAAKGAGEGQGRPIGVAYELEDGQIIYVPSAPPSGAENSKTNQESE